MYIYGNISWNFSQNNKFFRIKICRESQNTRFMFGKFVRKSCTLRDEVEKYCRARQATDDILMRRMRLARWIFSATNTHSEYVVLTAFPPQQWLRERSSILSLYIP